MQTARLIALVAATLAPIGAQALNLSDLWWNPAESGWGANIGQQDDTAVVTLYVYDADGEPTWLFGVASTYASGPGGLPHFNGTLYRTRGSSYGSAFDPAKSQATVVGSLWLTLTSANDSGTFELTGLEFTEHGVSGYLRTTRADRIEYGRFGGARY